MYSSCSIRTPRPAPRPWLWKGNPIAPSSMPSRPERPAVLLWTSTPRPKYRVRAPQREKERDVRRLTRRRHIDLGRVSSAFCCREV
ncbi:putative leader peptide [Streptomyces sp. NPDC088729]|uniref:putative leader peptide n=1 Tax=Streptomyces sp. NPDC088729 TaxID=3365876 RepID=UPI0038090CB7